MTAVSAVDLLPGDVRASLDRKLIARGFGSYDELVVLLKEHGHTISSSSLQRYGQKLKARVQRIREVTEAAKVLAEAANDDSGAMTAALIARAQVIIFDVYDRLENQEDVDPKTVSTLARATSDLARASVQQKKWAEDVRARIAKKLDALAAETAGPKPTLDAATVARVRKEIYGIV